MVLKEVRSRWLQQEFGAQATMTIARRTHRSIGKINGERSEPGYRAATMREEQAPAGQWLEILDEAL